jgi:hypothetical protein
VPVEGVAVLAAEAVPAGALALVLVEVLDDDVIGQRSGDPAEHRARRRQPAAGRGIAVLAAYAFGRDDDGYLNPDRQQLDSATYAITTEDIDLGVDEVDWAPIGRWTAVVMNADAARGIDVEADAGVKLDWAIWAGLGTFVVGLLMTVGAVIVILLIGRRASRDWTTG